MKNYDMGPLPTSKGEACIYVDGVDYTESDIRRMVRALAKKKAGPPFKIGDVVKCAKDGAEGPVVEVGKLANTASYRVRDRETEEAGGWYYEDELEAVP